MKARPWVFATERNVRNSTGLTSCFNGQCGGEVPHILYFLRGYSMVVENRLVDTYMHVVTPSILKFHGSSLKSKLIHGAQQYMLTYSITSFSHVWCINRAKPKFSKIFMFNVFFIALNLSFHDQSRDMKISFGVYVGRPRAHIYRSTKKSSCHH
jgi:hypothetical protein